jgi:hypothetical protein
LRPNLHLQPVPSLHVKWVPVAEVESGSREIDPEARPGILDALYMLRSQIQRDPDIVLRYLADMDTMRRVDPEGDWWQREKGNVHTGRATLPLNQLKEPATGDGILTLSEATLLYRAFFSPDEQFDLSTLRRRFLATKHLLPIDEERLVRGRETEGRRVSKAYRYV